MRVLKYLAVVFSLLLVVVLLIKILSGSDVNGSVYNPDGIELVYVEGTDNLPSFYIGKYEVTQAQYQAIMGVNPSYLQAPNHPVENVSWDDAQKFITRLNTRTGRNYRLPTLEEWVYAFCEGLYDSRYRYSGSADVDAVAWYKNNSGNRTHPVGQKLPNALGIYDMSGNVAEWLQHSRVGDKNNEKYSTGGAYTETAHNLPVGKADRSRGANNPGIGIRVIVQIHAAMPSEDFWQDMKDRDRKKGL
jgi:hypothetical protein